MISEGSSDTEDRRASTGINDVLKYIKIENSYFKIFQNITVCNMNVCSYTGHTLF